MREIDVRGLSCPEPVLIVMDELDEFPGETLSVLCDMAHTRDNLMKVAEEYRRDFKVNIKGRDFEIVISGKS
ncbi:MAG: sulfurtransferase TusA family protein [Clostridium sp.]|nr:sulfurtransferase TusA family protein [Clostridium sp.]